MKKILNITFVLFSIVAVLTSCEKDEIRAVLNPDAQPVVKLSAPTIVLTKDAAENDVLTVSWEKPSYGFDAAPVYTILIDKKGGDFSKAYTVSTGSGLSKVFKGDELNKILLGLGMKPNEAANLDVKVQAKLSDAVVLTSPLAALGATAYSSVLDLSTPWGVVGSAINDWGARPDGPFYKTANANEVVAYVTLTDGEIKFRKDSKWDLNYGDDGADGKLDQNGANIAVKAGSYKITFNTSALTYKIEKFSWGVVGSAYNDWGASPDAKLMYDPYSDQFRAIVTLKDGEMKFRKNEDWGENLGDNGANGSLDAGGDNIKVTKGNYLITVNFKDNTYSIKKVENVWGVVGSAAPNGWGGPDVPFALDYSKYTDDFNTKGVWLASNVTLVTGEIKFRANNDWGLNYGDTGANGSLEAGGDNIAVAAGTYDITIDFSGAAPTYKLTKK